ncbi:hypothetical protein BRADI_5g06187v3 [Brachypodium distachyon]|uniref:Uncharacterized protein n=1 Tax=Brachypodium distachyon TaxID=15368 RepID=A0A2K2CFN4_BRADI|nr:hypothetical protein BRADI_5g06187v3 [Brachypodium distachyon]
MRPLRQFPYSVPQSPSLKSLNHAAPWPAALSATLATAATTPALNRAAPWPAALSATLATAATTPAAPLRRCTHLIPGSCRSSSAASHLLPCGCSSLGCSASSLWPQFPMAVAVPSTGARLRRCISSPMASVQVDLSSTVVKQAAAADPRSWIYPCSWRHRIWLASLFCIMLQLLGGACLCLLFCLVILRLFFTKLLSSFLYSGCVWFCWKIKQF